MMKKFVAFLFVSLFVISSLAPTGAAQVVLNEILADPNRDWDGDGTLDSKLDEWVEVMNVGTSAVDLTQYRITDESAGKEFRFALSGTLAAGAVRVYKGADVVAWQTANGVSALGLSLNNAGDKVYLYRVAGSDTSVADSYAFVTKEVVDDRSVGRLPNGTGPWVLFDALNPYTGSPPPVATGCTPSPGQPGDCPAAVESSTWGKTKSKFSK